MAIATPEQIHRYSRRFKTPFEVLCALLVVLGMFQAGRSLLRYIWDTSGRRSLPGLNNESYLNFVDSINRSQFLRSIFDWLNGTPRARDGSLGSILPGLAWLLVALLVTLFIRNFFPTIRTSSRGLLIEWSNSWLPIGWEQVKALRVTEDLAGERYVLLLQTDNKGLTGWHRFYSFLYRLGLRRGVVITSAISNFEGMISTVLQELDSVSRQLNKPRVALDEKSASPLFQILLSPAGFFSRRTPADQEYVSQATMAAKTAQPGVASSIMATYPSRIRSIVVGITGALAVFGLLRGLSSIRRALGAIFNDSLGQSWLFSPGPLPVGSVPLWFPVGALIMIAMLMGALVVIRNLLPDVESRPQGLAVRYFNRWLVVPWNEITAVKSADLTKDNHVVLIQTTNRVLKQTHRISSLLFDGGHERGVLLTSALSTFEPLLQQIVLEVSRGQRQAESEDGILDEDAGAWTLRLMFKPSEAIDRLIAKFSKNPDTTKLNYAALVKSSTPMLWLAGLPTLILLVEVLVNKGRPPLPGVIGGAVFFFLMCFLEWPLVATIAQVLENNQDEDAHKARPFYLYPIVQLPRLLVLLGVLLLVLLGFPLLPTLLWMGVAVWSFLLTAGLWEGLYGWHGAQLLIMGAIPAVYQFLTIVVWGLLT